MISVEPMIVLTGIRSSKEATEPNGTTVGNWTSTRFIWRKFCMLKIFVENPLQSVGIAPMELVHYVA